MDGSTGNSSVFMGHIAYLLSTGYLNASSPNATDAIKDNSHVGSRLGEAYDLISTCLFAMICITGLIGNSLVVSTVIRWRDMKTSCNYLIMTIAMADIGVAVLAAPLRITERYVGWPFGELICQILVPLQDVFVSVSVVAHTAIALERYRAIVTPFKARISLARVKLIIVGLWLVCYIASGLPVAPLLRLRTSNITTTCRVQFPSNTYRRVYMMFLVLVFIASPLVMQTWAYFLIIKKIRKKTLVSCSASHAQRRNRLIKMLMTSLVFFDICYLPRGVLMLLYEYGRPNLYMEYANLISLVMYYAKHVINPVILFSMSTDFRAGFYASCICNYGDEIAHDNRGDTLRSSRTLRMARINSPKYSNHRRRSLQNSINSSQQQPDVVKLNPSRENDANII